MKTVYFLIFLLGIHVSQSHGDGVMSTPAAAGKSQWQEGLKLGNTACCANPSFKKMYFQWNAVIS